MSEKLDNKELTAFALGETSDFDHENADSEQLAEIEQLQAFAKDLESAFATEPKQQLNAFQKRALFKRSNESKSNRSFFRRPPVIFGSGIALAASVLLLISFMVSHDKKPNTIAQVPQEKLEKIAPALVRKVVAEPPKMMMLEKRRQLGPYIRTAQKANFRGLALQPNHDIPVRQGDKHDAIEEHQFIAVSDDPRSTFSVDVDTASYAEVRQALNSGHWPGKDTVKIEELVNYFNYDYKQPEAGQDFNAELELAICPWNPDHKLARIGIRGRSVTRQMRKASNLVFLVDVSGSMSYGNKLPLLKRSLKLLVEQLDERDTLSIVVYAGASGVVLKPTNCSEKAGILATLDNMTAGGSTNGGAGINLAYKLARENFIKDGNNRVILCTDGDFNVGVTGKSDLVDLAKKQSQSQIFLNVLGFGTSFNSSLLSNLSQKANGQFAFIDSWSEARRLFVDKLTGSLETIAKDVKIQVEFNPKNVKSYRLVGYENRVMAHADFSNDKKSAGDIGADHRVTAFYEIEMNSDVATTKSGLKYQDKPNLSKSAHSDELLTVNIRHKKPTATTSTLRSIVLKNADNSFSQASPDFQFAASVAMFGMILRRSDHAKSVTLDLVEELARSNAQNDESGYRAEFLGLVQKAKKSQPAELKQR